MKKIITVLLCMALLCTALSCGKKEDIKKNEETVAPAEDTAAEEEPYTLISEEDILGQWSVTLDLENSLSILGYTTADLFGDSSPEEVGCTAALELIMNYEKDGKGVLILTGEQIDSFFLNVYTAFYGYLSGCMERCAAGDGESIGIFSEQGHGLLGHGDVRFGFYLAS